MLEKGFNVLQEVGKKEYSFEEIGKKMSPHELLEKAQMLGIGGDELEIEKIKRGMMLEVKEILPQNGGEWDGEYGDSTWKPYPEEIPKRPPENVFTWGEILEKYGIEGIVFKDGEPDFSVVSEGTVKIDDFREERDKNYTQADEALAEQWTKEGKDGEKWTADDIRVYRQENSLTWHERSDMKTMDLVPQEVHGNIPHAGGISEKKAQNA